MANIEPWFSITYGAGIVADILTVPYPEHYNPNTLGTGTGPGTRLKIPAYHAGVTEGLVILAIYFVVMAIVGLWLFQHKEFTS